MLSKEIELILQGDPGSNMALIDINFSKNLSIPVQQQHQSYHRSNQQVSVHSLILKFQGDKSYHRYFSDDLRHDQSFVLAAIKETLRQVDTDVPDLSLMTLSDNCTAQYKSIQNFVHLQQ